MFDVRCTDCNKMCVKFNNEVRKEVNNKHKVITALYYCLSCRKIYELKADIKLTACYERQELYTE